MEKFEIFFLGKIIAEIVIVNMKVMVFWKTFLHSCFKKLIAKYLSLIKFE